MLHVFERFFYLKPVVVDSYHLVTARVEVIRQDIPRFVIGAILRTTDDPQGQSVEPNGGISLFKIMDFHFRPLSVELDVAPSRALPVALWKARRP